MTEAGRRTGLHAQNPDLSPHGRHRGPMGCEDNPEVRDALVQMGLEAGAISSVRLDSSTGRLPTVEGALWVRRTDDELTWDLFPKLPVADSLTEPGEAGPSRTIPPDCILVETGEVRAGRPVYEQVLISEIQQDPNSIVARARQNVLGVGWDANPALVDRNDGSVVVHHGEDDAAGNPIWVQEYPDVGEERIEID